MTRPCHFSIDCPLHISQRGVVRDNQSDYMKLPFSKGLRHSADTPALTSPRISET